MSGLAAVASAEFREAPATVRRQSKALMRPVAELVAHLRQKTPNVIVSCARSGNDTSGRFRNFLMMLNR